MTERVCVFQNWVFNLSMQQQSVLVLALRGPDGVAKFHPCKEIVKHYRATILKAAYLGRPLTPQEHEPPTFMSLACMKERMWWVRIMKEYLDHVDELPHHYHMHIMHGAQIMGYKHDDQFIRERWLEFYHRCCDDLHLTAESEEELDARLNDWGREHWDNPEAAVFK